MKRWDGHDGRLRNLYACLYNIVFSDVGYVCDTFTDNVCINHPFLYFSIKNKTFFLDQWFTAMGA